MITPTTISTNTESFPTDDHISRRFTALSGIPSFAIPKGARMFLRDFGLWYREYEPADGVTAIVPPNPTHATTFWTPFDDLRAAALASTGAGDEAVRDTARKFLGDENLIDRPITTLSAGERALVALAKCYLFGPVSTRAVVCDPSTWLYKERRHLVREALEQCPADGATHFLTLTQSKPEEVLGPIWAHQQSISAPSSLPWSLLLKSPVITFPARHFPTVTSASQIKYEVNTQLDLQSPTLVTGDNGIGKSSLMRALAGLLDLESGTAAVLVDSLRHRPRLLMHDTPVQLFALSPRNHLDWVYRLSVKREELATQIFHELQGRLTQRLGEGSPLGAIGDADNPTSTVQGKLALIAERLAGDAKMLILDEPTWGICDKISIPLLHAVADAAHKRNIRLLIISHSEAIPEWIHHSHVHLSLRGRSRNTKFVQIESRSPACS